MAEKSYLEIPHTKFNNQLLSRILGGEALLRKKLDYVKELDKLKSNFIDWDDYNLELLKRSFNDPNNEYYRDYKNLNKAYGLTDYFSNKINTSTPEYKLKEVRGKIQNCVNFLKRLKNKIEFIPVQNGIGLGENNSVTNSKMNKAFIVHGHDNSRKLEIARFLEKDLKIKTIILHEQANSGRTIIEKFEKYSEVDFAIALWTADDLGKTKDSVDLNKRARQNVIFETGFFIGKTGRDKVIVLYEDGVEIPSDYSGILFIPLRDNWKDDLRREVAEIYGDTQ